MYLHLGGDTVVQQNDIIGIFDLEKSTISSKTRAFLTEAEKSGKIINVSAELPKSFVVSQNSTAETVYICQLLPGTLMKRAAQMIEEGERKE